LRANHIFGDEGASEKTERQIGGLRAIKGRDKGNPQLNGPLDYKSTQLFV